MNRRTLIFATLAVLVLCGAVFAQTRLTRRTAKVEITDAGAVAITPKTGEGVSVGGGAAVKKVLSGTASLNFGATAAGTCDALTVTVPAAASGDVVALGIPATLAGADAYQHFWGYVSAANTVTVKRCNPTNATTALSDPAAATVRATVFQY